MKRNKSGPHFLVPIKVSSSTFRFDGCTNSAADAVAEERRSNFNQISKLLLGNLMIFTATAEEVGIDGYDEKGES